MFAQSSAITDDIESLAKKKGWKELYFSDKLKIQVRGGWEQKHPYFLAEFKVIQTQLQVVNVMNTVASHAGK